MRWIDRGPDPAEIAGYSQQYTQGWIDYYNGKDLTGRHTLPEPEDHEWSYYSETLGKAECQELLVLRAAMPGSGRMGAHCRPLPSPEPLPGIDLRMV